MTRKPLTVPLLLVLSSLILARCLAENWPQWRGPQSNGVSREKGLPTKWSRTMGVVWRTPLPGPGGSTPIVWNDRIFLTSADKDGQLLLMCLSTSGQEMWRHVVSAGNRDVRVDEGNSAANSPSTDGQHVWVMMANGVLGCFTVDGKEVWKLDLQDRYGKFNIQFGLTSTPVLDEGRLYLQLIHGDGNADTQEALLVCLDAKTNREIWKQSRVTGASQENEHSYSSPVIYRDGKHEYLLTHGGDYVIAHRLQDGAEIWRYCLNPPGALYHPTLRFVATPLAAPGFVVAPSAKDGPVVAIKADATGDISNQPDALLWRRDRGTPDVPSPVYDAGLVYLCRENGNLICVDAKTGETIYEERTTRERHRASPILADGKIYLTARSGVITVVAAGRKFEILSQNDVGESISSSPVIANGRIYLRTFDALYAIGGDAAL